MNGEINKVLKGIDFGFGKIKGSVIRQAGYDFVIRYASHSPGKNLTKEEYEDFKRNSLLVGVVFETTTSRPLSGYGGGKQDGAFALKFVQEVTGEPRVIYFAVDADYNNDQLQVIGEYFEGVAEALALHQIGVYGGYKTVQYMLDNNLAAYAWQTYAWSHGHWDSRAQLRQTDIYGPKLAGVACDTNESTSYDNGLF